MCTPGALLHLLPIDTLRPVSSHSQSTQETALLLSLPELLLQVVLLGLALALGISQLLCRKEKEKLELELGRSLCGCCSETAATAAADSINCAGVSRSDVGVEAKVTGVSAAVVGAVILIGLGVKSRDAASAAAALPESASAYELPILSPLSCADLSSASVRNRNRNGPDMNPLAAGIMCISSGRG